MTPAAGILVRNIDPRVIIAIGFVAAAIGLFHVIGIFYRIDFGTLVSYQVLQVFGIPLIFIPISTMNVGMKSETLSSCANSMGSCTMSVSEATHKALAQLFAQVDLQASVLAFKN